MILGIDVGTSVTKAALIDRDGRVTAHASRSSQLLRYPDGRVEQDLEEVISTVRAVAREVAVRAPGGVEAVAITAQGDGLWLRDERGRAVRPPISWLDARASDIVAEWNRGGATSVVQRAFELTGSGIFAGSHAGLIAYLARHEPESLERAAVAGHCADAVVQRLTGVITVDPADASMPFLDVVTRTYNEEAIALCGISEWRHLLAPPTPPGVLFALNAEGADLLGLPIGTPVSGGPFDVQACGIGCGSLNEGEGTVVLGTTLSCQSYTRDATVIPGSEPAGMWQTTPEEGLYLRVMPSMVGTTSVDWMRGLFGFAMEDLGSLIEGSPVGANGVRALSFLSPSGERAPFVAPAARGQFTGLELGSTQADIIRAMCEAVAYSARHIFDTIGLSGELSATGGGMKSRAWAQLFSDVLGRPIHLPRQELVGARGAALVAWDSLGDPIDRAAWRADRDVITPNHENTRAYDAGFARYRDDLGTAREKWRG